MTSNIIEDLGDGIIRVNLDPDRWYELDGKYYPSVTWILESYPKDIGFQIWLSKLKDWDEGRRILHQAGDRGSRVHAGIEKLLRNETLNFGDIMPGQNEPFTPEDWTYLLSFMNFYEDHPLTVLNLEETIIDEDLGYGGTVDFRGIDRSNESMPIIIDWKTSSAIYPTHRMQVAAYAKALNYDNAGIVRLGTRHKRAYQYEILVQKEIDYYFGLFENVYYIWQDRNQGAEPRYKTFKNELKLEIKDVEKDDNQKNNERFEGKNQDRDKGPVETGEGNPEEPRLF